MAISACSDDDASTSTSTPSDPQATVAITPPPLVTAVTTEDAGRTATIDGEPIATDRTLPPDVLSAENLEAVGSASTNNGESISLARATSAQVGDWEYVSPSEEGWMVWQPQIVRDVLSQAGAGARLAEVERVDWPNACLGVQQAEEFCAEVITPGYRIIIETDAGEVEYHTDLSTQVRRAGGSANDGSPGT